METAAPKWSLATASGRLWAIARTEQAQLLGIAALAAAVRFVRIGFQSLYVDEASTLAFAQRSFGRMLHLLVHYEGNAIPYYVAAYPLSRIGDGVVALRAASAAVGILAVVVLPWAVRPLVERRVAVLGAALLAVNAYAVSVSQAARAYAPALLVAVLAVGCLLRAVRDGGRWWLAYTALTIALFYLNTLCGGLLLVAQAAVPLALGRRALVAWGASLAATAAAIAPLVVISARIRADRNPFYWQHRPGLYDLARAEALTLGGVPPAAVALVCLVVAAAAARSGLPRTLGRALAHRRAPLVAWAFAPIATLFVFAQLQPSFSEQYLTVALPGGSLLLAAALVRLPRRVQGPAVVVALAAALVPVWQHATTQYREDWRGAVHAVAAARHPGDPVLFDTALGLVPAGVYDRAFAARDGRLVVPQWRDEPVPAGVTLLENPGSYFGVPDGPPTVRLVRRLAAATGRAIVVVSHTTGQGDVPREAGLAWARRACTVGERRFKAVVVLVISDCRSRS